MLLEVGCRETATARSRRLFPALELYRLAAARFHDCGARRCADRTSDRAVKAINLTSGQPLMKPSQDVEDHTRAPKYTTSVPRLREAWTGGICAAKTQRNILRCLSPRWVLCHEHRRSKRPYVTAREMKEGPSSSAIRCRSQATASCCCQKQWW